MKYLIDNKIVFNSDDGTMLYPASGDIIKLTLPASRLLEEFLSSDGRDLTRDYLLEMVWDRHGLQASGNNLNQYVSILRRNLALFGCPELIVTLPKVGFRLNTNINITLAAEIVPPESISAIPQSVLSVSQTGMKKLVAVMALILSLYIMTYYAWEYYDAHDKKTIISHEEGGCEVIYLKDISERSKQDALREVNIILKKRNIQCNSDNIIMYNREVSISNQDTRRTLLSSCVFGGGKEIISCDNLYHYKWIKP